MTGLIIFSNLCIYAQKPDTIKAQDTIRHENLKPVSTTGNFPKKALAALKQFNISGYYRFVTNYRHLDNAYPNLENNKNNIFVGDDSQIQQFMLNINGSLVKNTFFGCDLYMWTPMTGLGMVENVKGLNLGITLYGTYSSPYGDFTVRTGGINWYALTPFTFQTNKGYNRYSIFERNPWDPNTKTLDGRYASFYHAGAINQDERWGQQAFQGIIFEATNLPKGFSGVIMYGKTQLNGGLSPVPNTSFGGKIREDYGQNFISLNTFNSTAYFDSTERYRYGFNVITAEFRNVIGKFQIRGEVGAGRTFFQDLTTTWGEAVSLKLFTPIADKVPTELHVYRISPKVINSSSAIINTSGQGYINPNSDAPQPVLPAIESTMVPIGQLTNNRQGFDLNTEFNISKIKFSVGYSNSMELEKISSKITYWHPINSLVLAHFWRWDFPSHVGPYNNLSKIYRTVYETLNLTNIDPLTKLPLDEKYFNNIEINAKYTGKLFNRDYYIYYLGQYSSAQNFLAAFTVFTEKALLRTYYHQLEFYYVISPSFIWANYFGYERIIANYQTETDKVSRRPKNQTGYSIATGCDIRLSKGAGLYFRQRWMNYHDSSFENDKYNGFETTVEIKIFF
ncbi:MAG: hypothetical protein NTU51_01210 [Bacteroidetes bacterium]|nr:hypothetical protein [Bacteroidota bacterium]